MDTAMLLGTANDLRVWRYDIRRTENFHAFQPNIPGSVSVCIFRVSTCLADKEIPGPSVCLFGMSTLTAPLTGMLRINEDHGHPCSLCLVGDEASKLRERPTVQAVTLIFFSPCPISDAVDSFEGDAAIGALSQRYDAFRNYVIRVARGSLFFSLPFPQKSFGAFGALFLKFFPKRLVPVTDLINLVSAVPIAVRIEGYVSDSKVDAYQVHDLGLFSVGYVNCDVQKKLPVSIDQIALAPGIGKQLSLSFAAHERDGQPGRHCPDGNLGLVEIPRQQSQVVNDRSGRPKRSFSFTDSERVGDLGTNQTSRLRRQPKEKPNALVAGGLQFKVREHAKVSGPLRQPITGGIKRLHGRKQILGLYGVRSKFYLYDNLQWLQ
jgi:hypothetical protein